jgi:imidazolonepropionase-like amidohydrolase
MGRGEELGQVRAGFAADLLVMEKSPLEDVGVLDDPENNLRVVMKEGRVYRSEWAGVEVDGEARLRLSGKL